jgi:hypothetical protein
MKATFIFAVVPQLRIRAADLYLVHRLAYSVMSPQVSWLFFKARAMRLPRALPPAHFERNDVTIICETCTNVS